ncbi:MAG: endopeptidase La [Ktedonobacterales bacterium]
MENTTESAQHGEDIENAVENEQQTVSEQHQVYPLVLLKGTVIFPRTRMTLSIGREKSLLAVKEANSADGGAAGAKRFVATSQRQIETDAPGPAEVYDVATLVEIKQYEAQGDDTVQVTVEGVQRVRIITWAESEPFPRGVCESLAETSGESGADTAQIEQAGRALMRHAQALFEKLMQLSRRFTPEEAVAILELRTPARLADALATQTITEYTQQQDLLETLDPLARLEKVCVSLGNEIEILELENKIRLKVRQQVDKNQREYYLKEQLRAIQEELGNDQASEMRDLREKVAAKGLPDDALAKVNKELDRLERMPPHAAELVVLRNYIDWVLALPWQERTEDRLDMAYAQKVLDDEHFGLEKVKERIIEFLAVRQLRMMQARREIETSGVAANPNAYKGPILCLIGPPGVGKTSLGRSIAHALGRKFVRISLGGVHDEAEIRGHRRTYVGALPGRILQGMKTAGVVNPVFLLDEIDKLASDYRGDPSAALLEVLDPEQNNTFTDHYLEMPYDLSEVFFLCTGNARYQIPRALADRMDIIELPGYTEEEKIAIGRSFVMPKVLRENGLSSQQVQAPQTAMRFLVNRYTREAGVRNLERQLTQICRKAALRIVQKPDTRIRLTERTIEQYLGIPRYSPDKAPERGQIGVATGLAWTANGGALLPVEVVTMVGKGSLMITGQLGDVMQESARAALSYIRSRADDLDLPEEFPGALDIHIHLPEGAVPKDGPSAGITMATAIISALTRRPVRSDLAMTGEITLRGRVLPIGGLKEKTLAAHRVGIRHLLVPAENEKDLAEIPPKIRAEMTITLVETMDQVLPLALLAADAEEGQAPEGEEQEPIAKVAQSATSASVTDASDGITDGLVDAEPTPPAPSRYPAVAEDSSDETLPPPLPETPTAHDQL